MTDLRAAAQMALDALEEATTYTSSPSWSPSMTEECEAAATALRAALAQGEQEPVAQVNYNERGNIQWLFGKQVPDKTLLYAAPLQREWQSLTDEEIASLWKDKIYVDDFARAIEAKLKEKNYG